MDIPKKVSIEQKLSQFSEYWSPKIVGEMNDDKIQVVKLKGEFVWHKHDVEDELFYVLEGKLLIHFRQETIELNKGEMIVIPHGLEHKPEAPEEVHIILIEPKGTLNTGNVENSDLTNEAEVI
ncbi:cupin domain-containing protein [Candidatus Dojkabacteria bacterium]|uniref:Cupin domain-containing protein n=1 Tax=Candidatus Dojkabacteria bacterium TaxID=2099670 RepID=A0A955RKC4_9BACT|nr:cupin domain-containing protein [Candidatus Dojkabacteria bacterium]